MNRATRVNLFTYHGYRESWTRVFLRDPGPGLARLLPGLARVMGPYRTVGGAVARPMDLYVSQGHKQAGVVLIGDAFQASCPATGMGIVRLLTDIERLCRVHVPSWILTRISHKSQVHRGSDWAKVLLRQRVNGQAKEAPDADRV
ncbi:MAG: hypothetical protein ACJ8AW_04185 [Rhodopila sp.]